MAAVSSCLKHDLKSMSLGILSHRHCSFISSPPDEHISLLKRCTHASEISQIHGRMLKTGLDRLPFLLSKLLASSIVAGMDLACSIFNHVETPNLFMFTTMLRGFSDSDDPKPALFLFNHVKSLGIELNQFSFIHTLKACARLLAFQFGRGIHGLILRSGHGLFIAVKTTLMHFYCCCREIGDAHQLFDEFSPCNDSVSWNTLMGGYLLASQPARVVELFRKMGETGLKVGLTTILSILSASAGLKNHLGGMSVHGYCVKTALCSDLAVLTALIDMYAKTGKTGSGHKLFSEAPAKDVVLWNCLIDGYAKSGEIEDSLTLLHLMRIERIRPNSSTLAGLLSWSASTGCLSVGQKIHDFVKEEQVEVDTILGTALVDMYSKCGHLEKAVDAFNSVAIKDTKCWTAMISAYGVHGQGETAIELFHRMEEDGSVPNEITFLALLHSCSHGGQLVREAASCFERMIRGYGFSPRIEHYGCMIDLLGRAGLLEEAHKLIKGLPIRGDATAWRALLAACRVYGSVELGEHVRGELVETYGEVIATDTLLLSGTYAIAGRLPEQRRKGERRDERIAKQPGCSIINTNDRNFD